MANVKLKSIFTKEDIYTVLQLLKALADGVDENDTNMQAQIDELKQKIATLKPEPEGYSVDDSGNVTIAGALTANNNGDVEVGKKLVVNGNILSGLIGKATLPIKQGEQTLGSVDCWVGEGMDIISGGTPILFAISCMIKPGTLGNITKIFAGPVVMNTGSDTVACKTMDEVISKGYIPFELLNTYGLASDNNVQDMISSISRTLSDAKYQHTVHLSSYGDADKQLNLSFTAMSSKSNPVDSYNDLRDVFGGCNLTLGGNMKYYTMQVPLYLDLHGGSIGTDKIYCSSVQSVGAYQQPTLDAFPNITFTDNVVIPK